MFKENKTEILRGFSPNPLEAILWAREMREIETSEKYREALIKVGLGHEMMHLITISQILTQFSCPKFIGFKSM